MDCARSDTVQGRETKRMREAEVGVKGVFRISSGGNKGRIAAQVQNAGQTGTGQVRKMEISQAFGLMN